MGSASSEDALKDEIEKLKSALEAGKEERNELLRYKQQMDALFDNAAAEIYLKDREGRYLKINRQFEKIFGVKNEDLAGKFPESAHDPELAASTRAQDLAVLNSGEIITREEKARLITDDQVHTLFTIKFPVFDEHGDINGLGAVVTDITEQKNAEAKFRAIFMSAPVGLTLSEGEDARIIEVNPAYANIVGRDLDEITGLSWHSFSHPDDLDDDLESIKRLNDNPHSSVKLSKRYIKPDNTIVWVERTMTTIADISTPEKKLFLTVIEDITERKQFEEKIWHQANYDFLTDLPNRSMFQDRLNQLIKKSKRDQSEFAVLLIDLDEFKMINDNLGHDQGDLLLQETGVRISDCLRESDTVARLGGDEFVIILADISSAVDIDRIVKTISYALNQPYFLAGETVYVSASIGITVFPTDAEDLQAMLKYADQAMYQAKKLGRGRHYFYSEMMQKDVKNRSELISNIQLALDADEFQIYYQPIVELASDQVYKAEALIRWNHLGQDLLFPEDFIPISEETLLINKIGDWVFQETANLAKQWRSSIHERFQITINISAVQFYRKIDIYWQEFLESRAIQGNSVCLEIGEEFLTSGEESVEAKLRAFHEAGVEVSLDNFGLNHSSLAYIRKLDVDYIKISQSIVQSLTKDTSNVDICSAIIIMAHRLGIKVIAMGIETTEQKQILMSIGCDYGQGYFFSHPLTADEFENQYIDTEDRFNSQQKR